MILLLEKIKAFFNYIIAKFKLLFSFIFKTWVVTVILLVWLLTYFQYQYYSFDSSGYWYVVSDKGVKDWIYMIYTSNWTRTIEDSDLYLQYRSSDVYWAIEIWKCYNFLKQFGTRRNYFFSLYPNIIKVNECLDKKKDSI